MKRLIAIAYHKQTNGRAERNNKNIADWIRNYVFQQQDSWDRFGQPLTYCHTSEPQKTAGKIPLSLVTTRSPPSWVVHELSTSATRDMNFSCQIVDNVSKRLTDVVNEKYNCGPSGQAKKVLHGQKRPILKQHSTKATGSSKTGHRPKHRRKKRNQNHRKIE